MWLVTVRAEDDEVIHSSSFNFQMIAVIVKWGYQFIAWWYRQMVTVTITEI